ncbi:MAG: chromate efflux transporter [Kaiparowitsia implicata GSE-PSE-MK54-09C]|jgi:chromate transporter|nr:chromate efflux transporter [Kaiparowitsia implicata GSE-PSE-MK54-09C]
MGSPLEPTVSITARLWELARLFGRLGLLGFGGPQAHIAMINDEAVVRRGWMTQEEFAEGLAICEMLPGPASTQLGIYTGYVRAGQVGALVAGLCFIAPAFCLVVLLAWAYYQFQQVPQVGNLFFGVSPVVIALILGFCWKLGRRVIRDGGGVAIALGVFLLSLLTPFNVLLLFLLGGLVGVGLYHPRSTPPPSGASRASITFLPLLFGQALWSAVGGSLFTTLPWAVVSASHFWSIDRLQAYGLPLVGFFLRIGSLVFGGGLVIVPLMEAEVVDQLQWMTRSEFIDAIAVGELTPGPVVITAAFIGYKVAGLLGALVATISMFTPSFLFIMLASPVLVRLRQNLWVRSFLRGITPAALGAIAATAILLAQASLIQETATGTAIALAIALAALIALVRFRQPAWALVLGGAIAGLLTGAILP